MPNYNCSRYLPEAIESVLKQSYSNFEFIIIDDCSTDSSLEIINHYAVKDKRITVRVNRENMGQVRNLNLCLKHARGDYVKYVFSDDMLFSNDALKKMVEILESDDDIALVASSRYSIDESSKIVGVLSGYQGGITCSGTDVIKDCLITHTNKIGEPTVVMFRKKHALRGFDEKYNKNVDWEMWFHILEHGKFVYIDEPLCSFRTHPSQLTKQYMEKKLYFEEPYYMLKDYVKKPYMDYSIWGKIYIYYVPAYEIWNIYRKSHRITMLTALSIIRSQYGIVKFILLYPLYKTFKAYFHTQKRIKN
jgi:glycosyltransferase involved in cell wall biosynthesis